MTLDPGMAPLASRAVAAAAAEVAATAVTARAAAGLSVAIATQVCIPLSCPLHGSQTVLPRLLDVLPIKIAAAAAAAHPTTVKSCTLRSCTQQIGVTTVLQGGPPPSRARGQATQAL